MPHLDVKNYARQKAESLAGRTVWYSEIQGSEKQLGRVVGYYFEMGEVVLEVDYDPRWPVDVGNPYFTMVANFRPNAVAYVSVDVFLVNDASTALTSRNPHRCPRCGSPSFVLFRTVECSNSKCPNYAG